MFPRYLNHRRRGRGSFLGAGRGSRRRGFTLIEAAMTTVIVGVGFVATLTLISAGTVNNASGAERTTAVNLARNIRELTLQKTFTELPAFNGKTYSPAVDSRGTALTELNGWSQAVTVQTVNYNWITVAASDPTPVALKISVAVSHNGHKITGVSWYAFDGTP